MSTQANSPLTDAISVQAVSHYTRTAMVLHWIIAILIICNVVLGLSADSLPDDWVRPVVDTHKSIGITVFSGMLASTCLAVLFVPAFFVVVQRFENWRTARKRKTPAAQPASVNCMARQSWSPVAVPT